MAGRRNGKYVGSCCICGKRELARGWCYRHYMSNSRYGSPEHIDSEAHKVARSIACLRVPTFYWRGKKRGPFSVATRAKMSASHLAVRKLGRAHHLFGKSPAHRNLIVYRGVRLRSTYEVTFAKWLDARKLNWKYEPRRFDLGDCTYVPDFFVRATGAYWEIKGWFEERSQRKTALFRKLYPHIPLIVVTKRFYKSLARSI